MTEPHPSIKTVYLTTTQQSPAVKAVNLIASGDGNAHELIPINSAAAPAPAHEYPTWYQTPTFQPNLPNVYAALGGGLTSGTQLTNNVRVPLNVGPSPNTAIARVGMFTRAPVTQLAPVWPGFTVSTGQTGGFGTELPLSYTVSSWLEYPIGTYTQIDSGLTVNSGGVQIGGTLKVAIPQNTQIFFWTRLSGANGIPVTTAAAGTLLSSAAGEACEFGSSGVATTPQTLTDTNSFRISVGPCAIIGPSTGKAVYIVGDSRAQGFQDLADTSFDRGSVARSLGNTYPYINTACGGDRVTAWTWNSTNRRQLLKFCTHVIDDLGFNDLQGGNYPNFANSNQLAPHKARAVVYFNKFPYTLATFEPNTTSTDNWQTTTHQTAVSGNANRTSWNDSVRNAAGLTGIGPLPYIEVANTLESAQDSGLYLIGPTGPTGAAFYATPDGLHPGPTGYNFLGSQAQGVTFTSIIIGATALAGLSQPPLTTASFNVVTGGTTVFDTSTPKFGTGALKQSASGYVYTVGVQPATLPVTVECWVNTATGTVLPAGFLSSWWGVLSITSATGGSGFVSFKSAISGSTTNASAGVINDGAWHHIRLVTTVAGQQTVSVDGTPRINVASGTPAGTNISAGAALAMLADPILAHFFTGELDEVAIFNGSMPTTFTPPTAPYTGTEAQLICVFHFDSTYSGVVGSSVV